MGADAAQGDRRVRRGDADGRLLGRRRAPHLGVDSGSHRPEPCRHSVHKHQAAWAWPTAGRRAEGAGEGGLHAGSCAKGVLLDGSGAGAGAVVRGACRGAVRLDARRAEDGHRRSRCRDPVHVRHRVAGRVRYRARRLRLELKVPVPRRHPSDGANDLVRDCDGHGGRAGVHAGGRSQPRRGDRLSGQRRLARVQAADCVCDFPDRDFRRDEPAAVRLAGIGDGTGRRL